MICIIKKLRSKKIENYRTECRKDTGLLMDISVCKNRFYRRGVSGELGGGDSSKDSRGTEPVKGTESKSGTYGRKLL